MRYYSKGEGKNWKSLVHNVAGRSIEAESQTWSELDGFALDYFAFASP